VRAHLRLAERRKIAEWSSDRAHAGKGNVIPMPPILLTEKAYSPTLRLRTQSTPATMQHYSLFDKVSLARSSLSPPATSRIDLVLYVFLAAEIFQKRPRNQTAESLYALTVTTTGADRAGHLFASLYQLGVQSCMEFLETTIGTC